MKVVLSEKSRKIPAAVETNVLANFFAPEDFEQLAVEAAGRSDTVKQLLALLRNEPLPGNQAIPYLGETVIYEKVLRAAARDKLALNVGGTWLCRQAGESEDEALRRLRSRGWRTGRELHDIQIGLPSQVGAGGVRVTPLRPESPTLWERPGGEGGTATVPGVGESVSGTSLPNGSTGLVPGAAPSGGSSGVTGATVEPAPVIRQSLGAKTGINLLGDLEKWAMPDAQKVAEATLTFRGLTIKELRELCTRLPPKLPAELKIVLPPPGGPAS